MQVRLLLVPVRHRGGGLLRHRAVLVAAVHVPIVSVTRVALPVNGHVSGGPFSLVERTPTEWMGSQGVGDSWFGTCIDDRRGWFSRRSRAAHGRAADPGAGKV